MADYWISNPRKFCEFCKCWFADNKSSTQFHERGKRHQENVTKKIAELRKKGQKQYETQQELGGFLKQMEEGAMKAFKKDVAENPNLAPEYKIALVTKKAQEAQSAETSTALPGSRHDPAPTATQETVEATQIPPTSTSHSQNEWIEATSAEGHTYYWNTVTGVSQWEKPENFVPVAVNSSVKADIHEEKKTKGGDGSESSDDEQVKTESVSSQGVKRRNDAYGGWSQVATEVKESPDLQLPEASQAYLSCYVPQAAQYEPREELTFKEKVVGSVVTGDAGGSVSFKKRKTGGRQIRSRDTTS